MQTGKKTTLRGDAKPEEAYFTRHRRSLVGDVNDLIFLLN